jgi:hypothetical protein
MNSKSLAVPILGGAILSLGYFASSPIGGSTPPPSINSYLAELHLHGSLSEGRASMWQHSTAPARAGVDYDVLWWTDHMDRNASVYYPVTVDFSEGGFSGYSQTGPVEFKDVNPAQTTATVEGGSDPYGRYVHTNPGGSKWTYGGGTLHASANHYRISLFADPEIRVDLRLPPNTSGDDVNVVVRVILSSRPGDPSLESGAPNILVYHNVDLEPPTLLNHSNHNTISIPKFEARGTGFTQVVLRPLQDSLAHLYEGPDQSIHDIQIFATCRKGKSLQVEWDNFELTVDPAKSDKHSFVAAEQLLHSGQAPYNSLTQHVGMELAGPRYQKISAISTRDHIVALYRDTIENSISGLYDFLAPEWQEGWPRTGIDQVRRDNGVSILAHLFSTPAPPFEMSKPKVDYLKERVLLNRAWGADAIEVGYSLRGAYMETFLEVWDKLSAMQVYITGVGTTDHHNLRRWDLRTNNMGTWIRSTSDSPRHLADAIQSGHAFFGDPYRFDSIDGDMTFGISGEKTRMGEIHSLAAPRSIRFKTEVAGAMRGDSIVWLHNGVIVNRHKMPSGARTAFKKLTVKAGDWVRIELHTEHDEIYLLSNPIYFAAFGDPIPSHRRPAL